MPVRPAKALGWLVAVVILLTILAVDALLLRGILQQRPGPGLFVTALLLTLSLPLLLVWLYWCVQFLMLHYELDRNALTISCGTHRYIVPLAEIIRIVPGEGLEVSRGFQGVGWPGYLNGHMRLKGLGRLTILSTEPLHRQLVVVTEKGCYGISPKEPAEFLHAYAQRRALGATVHLEQAVQRASLIERALWRDAGFWGMLLLATLLNAALFGLIMSRYNTLPARIALRFDTYGQVLRIASRRWLLFVPAIGTLVLLTNTLLGGLVHHWERLGAHLFAITSLGVQSLLWLAVLTILNHGAH